MSDLVTSAPETDEPDSPKGDPSHGVAHLERLVTALVALGGLLLLIYRAVFARSGDSPTPMVLAFASVYALGKFSMGTLALIRQWRAWPALYAEGIAVIVVGTVVWTQTTQPLPLIACVALLAGASIWRGRVRDETRESD